MLNAKAFANAATVVMLGLYIVCRVASLVASDVLFSVGQSWFHTFNLNSVKAIAPMDMGTFFVGGISAAVLTWVTTYATIALYNKLAKK